VLLKKGPIEKKYTPPAGTLPFAGSHGLPENPGTDGGLRAVGATVLGYSHSGGGPVSQPFFVGKKNTPVNDEQSKVVIGNLSSYSVTWIEYYRYTSGTPLKYFESYPVTTGQAVSLAPK
jgi:hypothetical protein